MPCFFFITSPTLTPPPLDLQISEDEDEDEEAAEEEEAEEEEEEEDSQESVEENDEAASNHDSSDENNNSWQGSDASASTASNSASEDVGARAPNSKFWGNKESRIFFKLHQKCYSDSASKRYPSTYFSSLHIRFSRLFFHVMICTHNVAHTRCMVAAATLHCPFLKQDKNGSICTRASRTSTLHGTKNANHLVISFVTCKPC